MAEIEAKIVLGPAREITGKIICGLKNNSSYSFQYSRK